MNEDFLHDQGKSLVEAFFVKENAAVLKKFKEKEATKLAAAELAKVTGIQDENTLNHLIEKKISAETITAFSIYPLVAVAWADGKIDEAEREAVLKAAHEKGIQSGTPGYETLMNWLRNQPDNELFAVWEDYAKALGKILGDPHRQVLRQQTIEKARQVAEAAGGFLGVLTVSDAEKKLLERLEKAL